jgi:Fe-S-cluster-containing hydrogenase component 2
MAKVAAMLPPDLSKIAEQLSEEDQLLTPEELRQISLFDDLKKAPSFDRFPGFMVLRRCRPGRVICEQGEAGATAFAILSGADVLAIRRCQLETLRLLELGEPVEHREYEMLSPGDRAALVVEIESEVDSINQRCQAMESVDVSTRRQLEQVASAQLVVSLDPIRRKGGVFGWLNRLFGRTRKSHEGHESKMVPIDGPSDIDSSLGQAPLYEGELFGEMSCMNRSPRSATVVVTRDCYLLEMIRNVVDTLHNDPKYRERMDAIYRERVLESHVRQLPVFRSLGDAEFSKLEGHIELVEFQSGEVICEEFERSDCIYLIRSGVVKVVANAWTRLREEEFGDGDWSEVYLGLAVAFRDTACVVMGVLSEVLGEELQVELTERVESGEVSDRFNKRLLESINEFIFMDGIPRVWGKTRSDIESLLGDPDFCDQLSSFPESCQNWSQLETRTCRRWLLELSLPGTLPRRGESAGVRRTLAYLGRGESVGEMGVVLDLPRNATCVAYDHPDSGFHQRIPDSRTGGVPSRVELVKIPQDALRALMKSSPLVKSSIDATIRQRQEGTRQQTQRFAIDPASQRQRTPRFDELGLVQGQQLMLIDLDRCTRCGACVDACVAAHDDGNTRLYLDGPRYENYLVPLTCRKCLDPVCMIGCPVGAINRGNSGEIQVRDWCIGCRLCADQCPYGSIQMNHLSVPVEPDEQQWRLLGPDVEVKAVISRAVVCDMCSSLPGGPSCVYSCPHEAAIRVDSKGFFFDSVEISGGTGSLESVS